MEGEKVADAAGKIFPDYICVTLSLRCAVGGQGGLAAVAGPHGDYMARQRRQPVANYAADVVRLVAGAKIVPVPASFSDRWDLADELPEGITIEALGGLLLLAEAPKVKKQAEPAKPKPKPDLKQTVEEAKRHRDDLLRKIRALLSSCSGERRRRSSLRHRQGEAGGDWPQACRDAAVYLVRRGKERTKTSGVELLLHILEAFGDEDRLWTEKLSDTLPRGMKARGRRTVGSQP